MGFAVSSAGRIHLQCQETPVRFHTLATYWSKVSKPGFNSTWTENFQPFNLDLEKAEEMKLPSVGSKKMQENSKKTSSTASLTMLKPLTLWITTNCGKFWKRWESRPPDLPPEKSVCRSRSNRTRHGTIDWFQTGKGVCQGYVLSPCLFNLSAE